MVAGIVVVVVAFTCSRCNCGVVVVGEVVIAVVEEEVGAAAALVACACWIFWAAVLFRLAAASEAADIQIAVAGAIARSWEPLGDTGAVCIDFSWSEGTLSDPLNPKPSTLNPKPLNPKPLTLNPKPSTLNPTPFLQRPRGPPERGHRRERSRSFRGQGRRWHRAE